MSEDEGKARSGKARSQPLRRGKACLNCRHLKIKCDGVRLLCGQCKRVPKDDPCEFTDVSSRTMDLESTVSRLHSRINELEGIPGTSSSTDYSLHGGLPGWPRTEFSRMNSPFSGSSAGSRSSPQAASESSFLGVEEPPLVMIQMLLDRFLPHAIQFGFFLHIDRFRESVLLPLDWADPLRPSPALLSVVYLWGVHLSPSEPLLFSEPVFLKRAQQNISVEIAENSNPLHHLHTIQAQILLSTSMFRKKRILEAEFHTNGAATLALGYQLHKIRSARTRPEGERIRAFWTVACLQSSLNIALSTATTSFSILESAGADIDTPWPLEISDYAAGALPVGYQCQETLKSFLTEDPPPQASPVPTLYAKAAVLLHRASRLGSRWSANLDPQETVAYAAFCIWLDGRITKLWETLPPLYAFYADSAAARSLVLTHATTAAAAIKLHRSPGSVDPEARSKCVFAARAILACLGDTPIPE
ncbi:hypothetical protein DFH08DRAFT_963993 [Mycena albidolilacea]|uniref:Zn(2)-C6 fungal-type domain-containing protein n=1 Tax=Mycena albidolilacea TaxID=1033008 RepID=A0AAD7ENS2_9AGAR|nr:hypothetical protein DFH08DRAFT_963993 [Mycena albidolilacea]